MMVRYLFGWIKIFILTFVGGCSGMEYNKTVDYIDLDKFMGKWFVIAGRVTFLEKGAYNPIEHYTFNVEKNRIDIDFSFNKDSLSGPKKNIPQKLPINVDIQLRGELYGHGLSNTKSQALAGGHLRKKIPTGDGLSFCSYEILNSELNKHSQLIQLKKLGFEIPERKFTNFISEVHIYRKLWLEGKLFSKYPMDGIVLTKNSRKFQKQLYQYQYAIKC